MDKKLIFDICVFFTMIVLRIVFPKKRRGFKKKRKTGIKNQDYFTKGTEEKDE